MAVISTHRKLTQCWLGPVSSCTMYGTRTTKTVVVKKGKLKKQQDTWSSRHCEKKGYIYGRANTCRPMSGIVDIGGWWLAHYATARGWRTSLTTDLITNDSTFGGLVKCS